jgi:hypothetical protein
VFTKVSTFDDHSCALDDVGAIHCWGRDLFGYGTLSDAPTGKGYVDVSSGYAHSCAINENGAISCWGNDANGQVAGPPSPQQEDGYLDSGFDVGDIVWCEVTADNGITVGNTQTSGAVVVTASLPDPSDTCAEVMTQPYLPPGSYHWVVVNFQETVTLAPANLCTGYYSGGPDVLFRVRLRPGQTLDVGLEVTSPTNWVYDAQIALMSGCDDSWSQSQWMGECVAGKDSLNSPETLVYTNDTGFDEELTLALTKRSPNMGGLNFFADVDIY